MTGVAATLHRRTSLDMGHHPRQSLYTHFVRIRLHDSEVQNRKRQRIDFLSDLVHRDECCQHCTVRPFARRLEPFTSHRGQMCALWSLYTI